MSQFLDVQNPDALDAATLDLVGGYRIFAPSTDSPFYDSASKKPIHLGHVRNPAETYTPTTKKIQTGVNGPLETVLEPVTSTEETGTFESISVRNHVIRGLWAGSLADTAANLGATAAAFAAGAYTLGQLVVPATPNGHYYEVTAAGTATTEPSWPTTGGATVDSGTGGTKVTFTERGSTTATGLTVVRNTHVIQTGMLIDVIQSAIGRTPEISVFPNAQLRGDGYAGGRNSTDETSLKFAYTLLTPPATYVIPVTLGTFRSERITGGYDILDVPVGGEAVVIAALLAGYYGS